MLCDATNSQEEARIFRSASEASGSAKNTAAPAIPAPEVTQCPNTEWVTRGLCPRALSKPEIGVHRYSRLRGNDVTQKLRFDKARGLLGSICTGRSILAGEFGRNRSTVVAVPQGKDGPVLCCPFPRFWQTGGFLGACREILSSPRIESPCVDRFVRPAGSALSYFWKILSVTWLRDPWKFLVSNCGT